MTNFFADGSAVDMILALMLIEALVLAAYRWRTRRGIAIRDLVGMLLAGAFLLLALRAALTGGSWSQIAVWLLAALIAHLADLARRWRN